MLLSSKEIIQKFVDFYKDKGHAEIPNVSLVPENDSTLLFVNAGMFPMVPYLMGEPHPMGTRLVNVQRCLRLEDIEEVGDNRHTTAFHMLGNWSLDDYFKQDQLSWIYEFLFDILKLDPRRIYSTVFGGDQNIPRDEVSAEILESLFSARGIKSKLGERIFYCSDNWWMRGDGVGELGGPDTEIFYYTGDDAESFGLGQNPVDNEDTFIEIGNSVFMQYVRTESGWEQMDKKNVDFGGGLERLALAVQSKQDIFETDNFWPIIQKLEVLTGLKYGQVKEATRNMRIIADHIRSGVFLAMDGVVPSNKDQGYVLRRLLRRIVRAGKSLGLKGDISSELVSVVAELFNWLYPDLAEKRAGIEEIFSEEESGFRKTLIKSSKEVEKFLKTLDPEEVNAKGLSEKAFNFYQSLGYPEEIFLEDLREFGFDIHTSAFAEEFKKLQSEHKEKSRQGADKKFKGGLSSQDEINTKYHTATHLLHSALRKVLGAGVYQQGSNVTKERLRFDFSFNRVLTDEEVEEVEDLINAQIGKDFPVKFEILDREDALKIDALHFFDEKYDEKVKIYYVGDSLDSAFSKEFCGGPHVGNTSELSPLEIYRQKKIGQKTVRIYARFI